MEKLEEMLNGIATINDVPRVVFLNFALNNFKLDDNAREFSQRVEKTVGKVEILKYKTKSPFYPWCFQIFVL